MGGNGGYHTLVDTTLVTTPEAVMAAGMTAVTIKAEERGAASSPQERGRRDARTNRWKRRVFQYPCLEGESVEEGSIARG